MLIQIGNSRDEFVEEKLQAHSIDRFIMKKLEGEQKQKLH